MSDTKDDAQLGNELLTPEALPIGEAVEVAVARASRESGVLVVEDDPDTQWRLARMLTVHGARVVGTSSGEAALALIEQWPADLVLVDQGLPGISGLEVARRIRQQHPGIAVVLMSTEESTDLRLAAKVAGAAQMLIKPFRVEVVFEMLQRIKDAGAKLAADAAGLVARDVDDGGDAEAAFDSGLAPAE
jgi:DNA-binding response OmpR family regulator